MLPGQPARSLRMSARLRILVRLVFDLGFQHRLDRGTVTRNGDRYPSGSCQVICIHDFSRVIADRADMTALVLLLGAGPFIARGAPAGPGQGPPRRGRVLPSHSSSAERRQAVGRRAHRPESAGAVLAASTASNRPLITVHKPCPDEAPGGGGGGGSVAARLRPARLARLPEAPSSEAAATAPQA